MAHPQIETLLTAYIRQDALTSLLLVVVDDRRFWAPEGFLAGLYLQAVYQKMQHWGFSEIPPPDDDGGWRRAKDAGFAFKTWLTRKDLRVRKLHEKRHLEARRIDERFSIQAGNIGPMHPRDPLVAPQDRFNCRCKLAFSLQ